MPNSTYEESIKKTLLIEANALINKANNVDKSIDEAIKELLSCTGKLVITGVGKSGLVGAKMAATFASTGMPSFFVHPTEALHGDLGMIGKDDCVLAISYSGESSELGAILPHLKRFNVPIIGMTRNKASTLGRMCDIFIDITIEKEACPLGVAPTTSTTLTMALGDAIAVALMQAKNFTKEAFASFHPGGSLGKALFLTVDNLIRRDNLPTVTHDTSIKEALLTMSSGMLGAVFVVDEAHTLLGIATDGDLRRALGGEDFDINQTILHIANKNAKTIDNLNMLAIEALDIIENHKIQLLAVINSQHKLIGALHLHTLIEAGIAHATK